MSASARRPLVIVALGAFLLRLALLVVRGDYIIYDEGYYLLLARSLRAGHGFALNGLPHVALSPLQPLLVAGLSFAGIPDLWASRLIAALSGALLVFPVAWLARRWGGGQAAWRAGVCAAVFVATVPALLSFAPFAPHRWNLYFGSEPLFLLLALEALAAAVRAVDSGKPGWWALFGALGALAYLTRLEGAVLAVAAGAAALVLVLAHPARRHQRPAGLAGATLAIVVGAVVAAPYFIYLHGALGRWAVSGRVQAAGAPASGPAPAQAEPAAADPLQSFVWGGNREALWRALYALDASGRWMASQYWGVVPREARGAAAAPAAPASTATPGTPAAAAQTAAAAQPAVTMPSRAAQLARAVITVVPWWLVLLGLFGITLVRPRSDAWPFLAAIAVTTIVPALFAYVEPRALLLLVPAAAILGGIALVRIADLLPARAVHPVALLIIVALLITPVADLVRAWPQTTPLQQAASARRATGEFLAQHLAPDAKIVSWHPAVAIWARRDWRVLPYADLPRIMDYARAQRAAAVVLSSLEPSPLGNPPRAFTVILVDSARAEGGNIRLDQVAETPLVFVGRISRTPAPQ